jgi:hypothetical protein
MPADSVASKWKQTIALMGAIRMSDFEDIKRLLEASVLMHLNDAELGAYHDGAIDDVDRRRMAVHLSRCLICSRRLGAMQKVLRSKSEAVSDRDVARAKALLDGRLVVAAMVRSMVVAFGVWAIRRSIYPGLRARFATDKVEDGQTEDGALRWRYVEKGSGERLVRFGSHRLELKGLCIRVDAGPVSKTVLLEAVAPDQLGAEVLFTVQDCKTIPAQALLQINVAVPGDLQPEI